MTTLMDQMMSNNNETQESDTNYEPIIDDNNQTEGLVQRINRMSHGAYVQYRQTSLWCHNQSGYNQMSPTPTIREESHISSGVQT